MINAIGVANPTGNRRIAAVGEMAITKLLNRSFSVNEIKPAVSEMAIFSPLRYNNFKPGKS